MVSEPGDHARADADAERFFLETTTFAELGLSAKVLAAVTAAGYTTPTPIQAQAIPVAVSAGATCSGSHRPGLARLRPS